MINDNLILISGKSASGKSAAFRAMEKPEGVMYLNCEAGKKLPFPKSNFMELTVTDPMQIIEAFNEAEQMPEVHTIIIDSLTFLMNMYESLYVLNSSNTMKAWGDYAQYFINIMQQNVAKSTKNVIFTGHASDVVSDDMIKETLVQVKGSIMKQGVEAYFSTVVAAKKIQLKDLKDNESDLLTITPQEEALGFKHVFQVQLTKKTVNERIRSPMGMWSPKEIYIDNDCAKVLQRLKEYYA